MSIHRISRELVAYRNRLEQLAKDKGQGDVQLAGEEVASLIEELRAANEELLSTNRKLESLNTELNDKNDALTPSQHRLAALG
jgi:chemotaxis protein methyltransferase CheR/two-component system CheB/CheR fusion protein